MLTQDLKLHVVRLASMSLGVGCTFTSAGILYPITITRTGAADKFATPCFTPMGRYMKSFVLMGALSSPYSSVALPCSTK